MANVKKKAKAKAVISNLLVVAVILLLVSFTKNQQSDLKQFKIASGICTLLVEKNMRLRTSEWMTILGWLIV